MSSSDMRRALLGMLGLWGSACAEGPDDAQTPRLHRVVPAWGLNTQPVSAVLEGENFLPVATRHVGGGEPVTLNADFHVWLEGQRLAQVEREDTRGLRLVIPEGLTPGWYGLEVETPLGDHATLPRAYFVSDRPLAAPRMRASWSQQRVWTGEETHLVVTVENTGETRALSVRPALSVVGQVQVSAQPEPREVEPGMSADFTWTLGAGLPGTFDVRLALEGQEATSGAALDPSPVETTLQVGARAELTSSLEVWPLVANVGQRVRVTQRVDNAGAGLVRNVVPAAPVLEGPGTLTRLTPEPVPARADLPGGEGMDFVWTYVAAQTGAVTVQGAVGGTDDFTGRAVSARAVRASSLLVQTPGRLVASFTLVPQNVKVGLPFDVDLAVSNPGDSPVQGVTLEQKAASCSGPVELVSGPEPTRADIPGKGRVVFRARLVVQQRGTCVFHAAAQGVDQTDGAVVLAPLVDSPVVNVTR